MTSSGKEAWMAEKGTFPMLGKWLTAHFTSERRGVRKSRILKISVQELFKPRRKVSFP